MKVPPYLLQACPGPELRQDGLTLTTSCAYVSDGDRMMATDTRAAGKVVKLSRSCASNVFVLLLFR